MKKNYHDLLTVKRGINLKEKFYSCLICGYKGLSQNPLYKGEYQKTFVIVHAVILSLATVRIMMSD